jgi:hypothetical protein
MTDAGGDPRRASEGERVTRLKQEIARRTYRVDPEAVAHEILFKLRMITLGRRGLLGDPPGVEGPSIDESSGK